MTNQEKYNRAFIESLDVTAEQLIGLTYQSVALWDSVGHMNLISSIEETFDIMMDTDDIIDFSSYEKGLVILNKNYNVQF
jgi:acyl carrier protein